MRSAEEPWGISGLSKERRRRVRRANSVLHKVLSILEGAELASVLWGLFHPWHGFPVPAASSWLTTRWAQFQERTACDVADVDLCMWGS